jgi:hypothetical protein
MKAKKPKVPRTADDNEQSERFIQAAQDFGIEGDDKAFKNAFKKAVPPKPKRR